MRKHDHARITRRFTIFYHFALNWEEHWVRDALH